MLMDGLQSVTLQLLAYCQAQDWAGHDPYDALNSRLFDVVPVLNSRWPRLVFTQALKRSPIDLRRLLLVPRTQNPKALALFLAAVLKLHRSGAIDGSQLVRSLIDRLIALRSPHTDYWCWGYSFPWQTRTIVVPRWSPNLVCSSFVANALLDAYEAFGESRCLEMAASSADYIANDLFWTEGDSVACFSYPVPTSRTRVHNANILGAALLCRVAGQSGEKRLTEPALRVARYSVAKQQDDGAWDYGELPTQRWVDNFHTGYNLCGLQSLSRSLGTSEFEPCIRRGFEFYRAHFFREDGAPRYFHNRTYPLDIHCVAQSLITLQSFKALDPDALTLASSVYAWAMKHMWDSRGFFYYRVLPCCTIRTSYMRWSQAWMLLALSTLWEDSRFRPSAFNAAPAKA
jgi:hypothetical protein